jgi:nicotinamidase-related amidase
VKDGREIVTIINKLAMIPFDFIFATKDFHPPHHCSFASQHPGAEPFVSKHTIRNPEASNGNVEEQEITLWPDHCVQGTPGCELLPELDTTYIEKIIEKGGDPRVEAYSGFGPPFRNPEVAMSGLSAHLRDKGIERVFVCGLALDYCVKCTAIDIAKAGYETFVVEDATKAVDQSEEGLKATKREMEEHGVTFLTYEEVLQC